MKKIAEIRRLLSTIWVESDEEKVKALLKKVRKGFYMVVGRCNAPYYYSSFIRLYSPSGEYITTLPYVAGVRARKELKKDLDIEDLLLDLGWEKVFEKVIGHVYDRLPEDPTRSYTGGDYFSGWRITYSPPIGYITRYNSLLHSLFESEGWEEPKTYRTWAELISALEDEELVWDYDPDLLPESDTTAHPQ